jgi:hypothetical protein
MTTRPGYVWDDGNNEWVEIGQAAVVSPFKYQATAPSSPATGDIWIDSDDEAPGITSSLNYRWRKIAAGGETSLSGNDSSGLPLAYNPGYEQVYLNGVLQYRGSDYVATTGNTITGLTALVASDTIEVLSFVTAPIGDTYGQAAADSKFVNKTVGGLNLIIPTGATGGTVSANGAVTIGSGVSFVSITGAFSAAYDNYKIVISGGSASTPNNLILSLNGATSGYYESLIYATYAGGSPTTAASNNGVNWPFVGDANANGLTLNLELLDPFLAKTTRLNGAYITLNNSGYFGGYQGTANSYSGFSVTATSGTMTGGTIRIYGYNNGA